ncbi:MAG: class I SAM-dependent methyltransferase [Oscillospiraceae bacterium]|nr:class I SAM-dependent methyltransferase [Oscillospiraceae bacterium]
MAFQVTGYDAQVRQVIPLYDEIHAQILDMIETWRAGRPIAWLDTGCGSGTLALRGAQTLDLTRLVLCDPSEQMLEDARQKLAGTPAELRCIGSEAIGYEGAFDVVTAVQSHHYFDPATRALAVANCYRALKPGGLFITFENTAPDTDLGKQLVLRRIERYGLAAGRSEEAVAAHTSRYGTEYFPLTAGDHLDLLRQTGFSAAELFWRSYLQCGFYAIR